jgi:hypothetical protein
MIASIHIADVGWRAPGLWVKRLRPGSVPGLRYADMATTAPLGGPVLPVPTFGRVGLIAAWEDEAALEGFLSGHALAQRLAHGWHVRLEPTRASGAWSELPELAGVSGHMDDDEPAAVITLGRLRLTQAVRFLRANGPAADLAASDPAVLARTALARPPHLVATFSLWRTVKEMRDYAYGAKDQAHRNVIRAQEAKPFHHESTFIRFRPYAARGTWDGRDPLAGLARG